MMAKKRAKSESSKTGADVRKLYELMVKEDLQEVSWSEGENLSIRIRRKGAAPVFQGPVPQAVPEKPVKEKLFIRSPMNGVFYDSPSPGADTYVKAGDEITPGTTVCIIEAMKLMNEVQIERDCRIIEVVARNASPVKVNDPLFEIEHI